jgi:hypothetical protein
LSIQKIITQDENGFNLAINSAGMEYVDSLLSEYALMYRAAAKAVREFMSDKTEHELFALIINSHKQYSGEG